MNNNIIEQFTKLIQFKKRELLKASKKEKFHKSISLSQTFNALKIIKEFPREIKTDDDLQELGEMKGVGQKTILRIKEILKKGYLTEVGKNDKVSDKKLKQIEELEKVINIGYNKAKELVTKHKISSIKELKEAHKNGKIELNDKILLGLKYHGKYQQNIPRIEILEIDNYLNKIVKEVDIQLSMVICGSYRRLKPFSNDIDVLITHPDIKTKKHIVDKNNYLHQLVYLLENKGFLLDSLTDKNYVTKYMGFCRYKDNPIRRIDIRFIHRQSYYSALLYFTGSGEFNIQMREHAINLGYKLNEYGLYKKRKDETLKRIPVKSEKDIFDKLGLEYVEPQDRI